MWICPRNLKEALAHVHVMYWPFFFIQFCRFNRWVDRETARYGHFAFIAVVNTRGRIGLRYVEDDYRDTNLRVLRETRATFICGMVHVINVDRPPITSMRKALWYRFAGLVRAAKTGSSRLSLGSPAAAPEPDPG